MALDLLSTSALLVRHAEQGKVVLGVNHSMSDFQTGRRKKLDLVIAVSYTHLTLPTILRV